MDSLGHVINGQFIFHNSCCFVDELCSCWSNDMNPKISWYLLSAMTLTNPWASFEAIARPLPEKLDLPIKISPYCLRAAFFGQSDHGNFWVRINCCGSVLELLLCDDYQKEHSQQPLLPCGKQRAPAVF